MLTLEEQLEAILSKNVESLINHQKELLAEKISKRGENYILFGAGHLGRLTLTGLRKAGIEPIAFADNNPGIWDTSVDGISVLSPEDAAGRYAHSAIFVIAVYTSQPVWEQLTSMGLDVISFAELAWMYPQALTPHGGVEHPHKIFEQADDVREAFSLWADEPSRREYLGQLNWRTSLDRSKLPPHLPQNEIYFADELIKDFADEVFVDCGAFDGDTIQEFLNRRGSAFERIIAIEPDPSNCKALERRVSKLPAEIGHRIQVIHSAAGAKRFMATFNATGTAGSSIGNGSYQVECLPIDELPVSDVPTFIKMDIEGAEPDALLGASRTIQKATPVLAICLYHSQEHLWQIPLLIQSLGNEYKFFLRRYADECWEIVCYAVPTKRLMTRDSGRCAP